MSDAVIMAGGRNWFWPQSRQRMPKQLLRLAGDRTMIQQTFDRCRNWVDPSRVWVVTNEVQAAETAKQLPEILPETFWSNRPLEIPPPAWDWLQFRC